MNRSDRHLSEMQVLERFEEDPDSINPMYLFWSFHQPDHAGGSESAVHNPVLAQLQKESDTVALERLDALYRRYRPHSVADRDDSAIRRFLLSYDYQVDHDSMEFPGDLKSAIIFIHVAAVRALILGRTNGFSEEMKDCLDEVERTFMRFRLAGFEPEHRIDPNPLRLGDEPNLEGLGIFLSTLAVTAISYVNLSRISRRESRYADALHYLAEAGRLYEYAIPTPLGINDMWPLGSDWRHTEYVGETLMDDSVTGIRISLKEFTDTFDLIKQSASLIDDWSGIVADCRTLAGHHYCWRFPEFEEEVETYWDEEEGIYEIPALHIYRARITEEDGSQVTWGEYWRGAKAWASAQLSRSEYREMRRRDDLDASERRLEKYFFGDNWSKLPVRAQERIIVADIIWTSYQRVDMESLLNELQRASEEMCYAFIWDPLLGEQIASEGLLIEIEARMAQEGRQEPNMGDFLGICDHSQFVEFLRRRALDEGGIQFMSESLPVAMGQLRSARNLAEHEMGSSVPGGQIEELYWKFLGIGRAGILPEHVRNGTELRVSRRSR